MVKLDALLKYMKNVIGTVEVAGFRINIIPDLKKINSDSISQLYFLLNNFEKEYFITIQDTPFCLLPDASDHIWIKTKKKETRGFRDKTCKKCDFAAACCGWPASSCIERKNIKIPRNLPKEIVFELTNACNLSCRICTLEKKNIYFADCRTVCALMNEARTMGIRAVRFTGGDPFSYPDIAKLLSFARKNNFYTLLNTNATIIKNSDLALFQNTVDNVLISMQGFNKKSDNFLTRSSLDFKTKITNIKTMNKMGKITRIGTVISKTLLKNFLKYYCLLRALEITEWELFRPLMVRDIEEYAIFKKDLLYLMDKMYFLKNKKEIHMKIANPVPYCLHDDNDVSVATLGGALADDGHSRIVWDARGYFKPSYFIDEILGESIKEAWSHPLETKIRALTYLPKTCQKCPLLKWCRGGSRASAGMKFSNYFLPDPLLVR